MIGKHFCSMCGSMEADVIQLAAYPRPDESGIECKVTFLCPICGKRTSVELDGIVVDQLSKMVDQIIAAREDKIRTDLGLIDKRE